MLDRSWAILIRETGQVQYVPRAYVGPKENRTNSVRIEVSWSHGYDTAEKDAAYRAAGVETAQALAAVPEMLATVRAVLAWAKAPGNHGGNPYGHEFVKLAQAAADRLEHPEFIEPAPQE